MIYTKNVFFNNLSKDFNSEIAIDCMNCIFCIFLNNITDLS